MKSFRSVILSSKPLPAKFSLPRIEGLNTKILHSWNANALTNVLYLARNFHSRFSSVVARPTILERKGKDKDKGGKNKGKSKNKDNDDENEDGEIDFDVDKVSRSAKQPIEHLKKEFEGLRATRATPSLLEKLSVEMPKGRVSLQSLGQIVVKDPQLLQVTLYDETSARAVEKAIADSELGFSASSEGTLVKVRVPKTTKEYREQLTKLAAKSSEQAKVNVRQVRKNALDLLKKAKPSKDAQKKKSRKRYKRLLMMLRQKSRSYTTQKSKSYQIFSE